MPVLNILSTTLTNGGTISTSINATGESVGVIGPLNTTSKTTETISALGGGSITFYTGTTSTFIDPGSTLRIGIQELNATNVENGIYLAYLDLVGGTDVLVSNTRYTFPIETGSVVMSPGTMYAVVYTLISRGGTDTVNIRGGSWPIHGGIYELLTYRTQNTGGGIQKTNSVLPLVTINFDSGEHGFLGIYPAQIQGTSQTLSINSSGPIRERGVYFKAPISGNLRYAGIPITALDGSDIGEVSIYSNPRSNPVKLTNRFLPAPLSALSSAMCTIPINNLPITAGEEYGITLRVASGSIALGVDNIAGDEWMIPYFPMGGRGGLIERADTGIFTDSVVSAYPVFQLGIDISVNDYPTETGFIGII